MNSREKKAKSKRLRDAELVGEKLGQELRRHLSKMLQMGFTLDVAGNIVVHNTQQLAENFLETLLNNQLSANKTALSSQVGFYAQSVEKLRGLTTESKLRSIPEVSDTESSSEEPLSDYELFNLKSPK